MVPRLRRSAGDAGVVPSALRTWVGGAGRMVDILATGATAAVALVAAVVQIAAEFAF